MLLDPMVEIVVEAVVTDPYDGVIRPLADAQRFGFELLRLALVHREGEGFEATISLRVPRTVDAGT